MGKATKLRSYKSFPDEKYTALYVVQTPESLLQGLLKNKKR